MTDNPQTVEQILLSEGKYVSTTVGVSMRPLFRNRKDTVVIRPISHPLNKYDVPLYRRADKLILHRIVKVTDNGYVICGDNCENKEYDITDENIIGVMTEFYRNDKHYSVTNKAYILYSKIHVFLYPIRRIFMTLRRNAAKVYHKLKPKKEHL